MVDKEKEMTSEKARESKAVEAYIAEHKIIAQKTAAGTFVEIKSVGDGPGVDSGKLVSVLYTGKYFPSGKVFETNTSGAHTEPIKFVIGQQRGIIQGWDDGLRLFKKGGKGSLYIPAFLAYGQQAAGPSHKPFENLIFDVEIVGVENAPPPPPANATKLPAFTLPKQNPAAGNKK